MMNRNFLVWQTSRIVTYLNKLLIIFGWYIVCKGGEINGKQYKYHTPDCFGFMCGYCNQWKVFKRCDNIIQARRKAKESLLKHKNALKKGL